MQRIALLEKFNCLGTACEDTCCQGWGMKVDAAARKRFEQSAPELLDSYGSGEADFVMKRDCNTDRCIKLDNDLLCGIQKQYGDSMLPDACHFYPRLAKSLSDEIVMSAAMSCPEIVRLALSESDASCLQPLPNPERMPESFKDCLPEGLTPEEALAIHRVFLDSTSDSKASPERIIMRIVSVSQSLMRVSTKSWPSAADFYFKHADERLVAADPAVTDIFFLLQAMCGIMAATNGIHKPRLLQTIASMEYALDAKFDWESRAINTTDTSLERVEPLLQSWNEHYAAHFAPILRRWTAMQLSAALFPFYGFGATLHERAVVIGVRFATLKLALMCACFEQRSIIQLTDVVRIVQSLSRCLDHLANPTLSLKIYTETGWINEGRLRALVGDST